MDESDSSPERKHKSTKEQDNYDLISRIDDIISILDRAFPNKTSTLPQKIYHITQVFVRYVGIPAILIAAILPVYELMSGIIEFRNRQYIRSTYVDYAVGLTDKGEYDRAKSILGRLEKLGPLDAQTQYKSAKVLAEMAFRQGRAYEEAEDAIRILLSLHSDSPAFFPEFGGDEEILSLEAQLVEILIQRSRFDDALNAAERLKEKVAGRKFPHIEAQVHIQIGKTLIALHRLEEGKKEIENGIKLITSTDDNLFGVAYHSLGGMHYLQGDNENALNYLLRAEQNFVKNDNKFSLIRTYNNLSLVYDANLDYYKALASRKKQLVLARETADERIIGTTLVGLSQAERHFGNFDRALSLALEAEELFDRQKNFIGLATALQAQANVYVRQEKFGKVLYLSQKVIPIYIDNRNFRGVWSTLGIVGRAALELGDEEEMVFALLGSIALKRHTGYANSDDGLRDVRIQSDHLRSHCLRIGFSKFENMKRSVELRLARLAADLGIENLDTVLPFMGKESC